jgi:hypothetical protein
MKSRYEHNNGSDAMHEVELYYFTNQNRYLEIKRNFEFSSIEMDLMVQSMAQNRRKVKIYSEDAEARWFLKKLINSYLSRLEILDISMSCAHLIELFRVDSGYFGNVMIILDGDVSDNDINKVPEIIRNMKKNIVKLPGTVRPEQVIYEYLNTLPKEHTYWTTASAASFNWDSFKSHDPTSSDYSGYTKDREKYKKWFINHKEVFDETKLYDYWAEDNPTLVEEFLSAFVYAYNSIAGRQSVPNIHMPSV